MRTTLDLPPVAYHRVKELAAQRGESVSRVLADLTMRGLAQVESDVELQVSDRTGLPVLSIGRGVTSEEVGDLLDDE